MMAFETWLQASFVDDTTLAHLFTALVLGTLIGIERQLRQRTAGLRTNVLVCVGAASFVDLAATVAENSAGVTQVIAYVVSGVGFLGAGAIMKEGPTVRGLNTAATVWCSAAVGASAATGNVQAAVMTTAVVVFINVMVRPVVQYLDRRQYGVGIPEVTGSYSVRIVCGAQQEAHVRSLLLHGLGEVNLTMNALESADVEDRPGLVEVRAEVRGAEGNAGASLERIAGRLSLEPSISAVRWQQFSPIHDL